MAELKARFWGAAFATPSGKLGVCTYQFAEPQPLVVTQQFWLSVQSQVAAIEEGAILLALTPAAGYLATTGATP